MTDLENFPTRESAKQMLGMVSPIYDKSYVGKWMYEIMGLYYNEIINLVKGLRDEMYPQTATWTLPIWAEEYGVDTSQSDEDIREEILSKRGQGHPMNPKRIAMIASKLTGRECSVEELSGTGVFKIHIQSGDIPFSWKRLTDGIDKRKQAHLSYEFGLDLDERLNLGVAHNVKESKHLDADETIYEPYDPLERVGWLVDELGNTLVDENGNFLL